VTLGPHKKSLKNVLNYAAILLNESESDKLNGCKVQLFRGIAHNLANFIVF
jgi:hypothetical protein